MEQERGRDVVEMKKEENVKEEREERERQIYKNTAKNREKGGES